MEKIFKESGFQFDFTNSINVYKADEPNYHGLSAVDFIIETPGEYLFVEVKNPDNKKASQEEKKRFLEEMKLPLYPLKMSTKFKDSLLKELASGKVFTKPIHYILLLEFSKFDAGQRRLLYQKINNFIPRFSEEEIYRSVKNIRFILHNKNEFISAYNTFNVTSL